MHIAELHFTSREPAVGDAHSNAVHSLLAAYYKSGQIGGSNTPLAQVADGFVAVVRIPEQDALVARHDNAWVRKARLEIRGAGVNVATSRVLGHEPDTRAPCACRTRPFLLLFTTFLHVEPAVRCGTCGRPVSLYRLPPTDLAGHFEQLLSWVRTYQSLDQLFVGSGPGETLAHAQLSRHDSALSKDGRAVAQVLEQRTGVPVYYFLSKNAGRSVTSERRRRCPSCHGAWLRAEPLHGMFDFQCEPCRLLGNIAFSLRPGA